MKKEYVIKVPATSANLGPGFDCLGIALGMYNTVRVCEADELTIVIEGEGKGSIPTDSSNLVYTAYRQTMNELGLEAGPISIRQQNDIPASRGLGSSGNAVVAGINCALAISGQRWKKQQILNLASRIEGHPDNVAPAIFGGFTICIEEGGQTCCIRLPIEGGIRPVALIPGFELSTKQAREVLPKSISHKNAVYNTGHAAYLVAAIATGEYGQIINGMKDKLHQPYRSQFIPLYDNIMNKCEQYRIPAYLSGAGPTIMAITTDDTCEGFIDEMDKMLGAGWSIKDMKLDNRGAYIE